MATVSHHGGQRCGELNEATVPPRMVPTWLCPKVRAHRAEQSRAARLWEILSLSAAPHFTALCLFGCCPTSASTHALLKGGFHRHRWEMASRSLWLPAHRPCLPRGQAHIPRASPQSRAAPCPHRQPICCHFLTNPSSAASEGELMCLSASLPSPAELKQPQVSPLPAKPHLSRRMQQTPSSAAQHRQHQGQEIAALPTAAVSLATEHEPIITDFLLLIRLLISHSSRSWWGDEVKDACRSIGLPASPLPPAAARHAAPPAQPPCSVLGAFCRQHGER